jgi:hypothetical protein
MKQYPLVGVSIIAVVILSLASLSNVVGYQSVQSSNQKPINGEVDQKELLFQTIVDIANNKEIQRVILKLQVNRDGLLNPDVKFSVFNTPILTKNQVKQMYLIGLILSKIISKSKIHSMAEQYQLNNQGLQKEISAVIQKDAILKGEITQLSNSQCDCEKDKAINWSFPVICTILFPIVLVCFISILLHEILYYLTIIIGYIGILLHCFWSLD